MSSPPAAKKLSLSKESLRLLHLHTGVKTGGGLVSAYTCPTVYGCLKSGGGSCPPCSNIIIAC